MCDNSHLYISSQIGVPFPLSLRDMHRLHLHPIYARSMGRKQHIIASLLLRDFAFAMSDMFVPIILLIEGYPLYWIGLFYVVQSIVRICTELTLPAFFARYGVQNCLRMSFYLGIGYIVMLNYLGVSEYVVIFAGMYAGIMNTFYWIPRHIDTITVISNSSSKSAQDVSKIEIGTTFMRTLAPFIGGLIAQYISIQVLFGVAFGILVSASFVISQEARSEKAKKYPKPDLRKAFSGHLTKAQIANFGMNFQSDLSGYVWPTFMYLSFTNLGAVGGVLSFTGIVYAGLVYRTGKAKERTLHFLAGISTRITSFVLRVAASTPLGVVVADVVGGVGHGFFIPLYMDEYYSQAKVEDMHANVISMELIGDFGKLTLWSSFTWLTLNFSQGAAFDLIFILGIPAIGITMLMLRKQT